LIQLVGGLRMLECDVEDGDARALELEREADEVVVLLPIMGIARADPARAARTKENEACIFDDG